jgi:hypothetical protein
MCRSLAQVVASKEWVHSGVMKGSCSSMLGYTDKDLAQGSKCRALQACDGLDCDLDVNRVPAVPRCGHADTHGCTEYMTVLVHAAKLGQAVRTVLAVLTSETQGIVVPFSWYVLSLFPRRFDGANGIKSGRAVFLTRCWDWM